MTGADVPMPYSKRLEQAAIPHAEHVVSAALATLEGARLMATDIVMPRLSDSMEEGTILNWMKSVGDEVALGDELVEIETDKANMVYEADAAGTLIEILAEEGDTLPIGEVIARVGEAGGKRPTPGRGPPTAELPRRAATPPLGEPAGRAAEAAPRPRRLRPTRLRTQAEAPVAAAVPETPEAPTQPAPAPRRRAGQGLPLARRIASEKGLDLAALSGSGPGGRIVKADVEGAGAAPRRRRPRPRRPRRRRRRRRAARDRQGRGRGTS